MKTLFIGLLTLISFSTSIFASEADYVTRTTRNISELSCETQLEIAMDIAAASAVKRFHASLLEDEKGQEEEALDAKEDAAKKFKLSEKLKEQIIQKCFIK